MVEFDVSADKSSTESESEGLPLTQLPAATAATSALMVLLTVTADRRAVTLPANKCVICILYISQIFILSSIGLSELSKFFFYQLNLPVAACQIKLICLPKG